MSNLFSPKVIDIDIELLDECSIKLAKLVTLSDFRPDHVMFVERAGLLIGDNIAIYLGCSISGIAASRSGGSTKTGIKLILQYLPRFITHALRRFEVFSNVHELKSKRKIIAKYPLPEKNKKILLVDDAIDTGNTINAIIKFLLARGYSREYLKIAVITTTKKHPKCNPDYSLFDQVICAFPWSYDSKEYSQAWKKYKLKKEMLCHKK